MKTMHQSRTSLHFSPHLKPLVAAVALLTIAGHAAAVGNGTVAAGAATIGSNGATTTINQSSNRAIVNWNNFDIGASERVQINQPNAGSAILNRVNSSKLTQIDGALNANGRVFVVNPNGIVVGKTGTVNAASVVLSSLDIQNSSFMNSDTASGVSTLSAKTTPGAAAAAVVNHGVITASDSAVLLASKVVNTGEISTANALTLAAGDTGAISITPDTGISASAKATYASLQDIINKRPQIADNTVVNEGRLSSIGIGNVTLTSAAYGAGDKLVISNTGSIVGVADNRSFLNQSVNGGNVRFLAPSGTTQVGGDVAGGFVSVRSGHVAIDGTINATRTVGSSGVSVTAGEIPDGSIDASKYGALAISPNAHISGDSVSLTGDTVKVDGRIIASKLATVTGITNAEVIPGALQTPYYEITSGGKFTSVGTRPY